MRQHYQNQLFSFITFALLTLISVSSFTATAQATINPSGNNIIYVNTAVIGGTGDGSSWANAIPELADALKYARTEYNADNTIYDTTPLQIYVAIGTYKPLYHAANGSYTTNGGRYNSFVMVKNVQIYGGFDPANNITDLTHNRILPDNNATVGTILSGDIGTLNDNTDNAYHVIISSGNVGNALLNGVTITQGNANGVGSITVNGNAVRRDTGGGMCNISSSPLLTYVNITDNTTSYGGGMFNESSSPVLTNINITNNTAAKDGGGMYSYSYSYSSPILTNVNITDNTANRNGGGMYNSISSSSPQVYNSIVYGNTASTGDNVYNNNNSTPQFYNSLIEGSGGSTAWVASFGTDGGNNIDATTSPFTDAANGDFSLVNGSPAINAGNNQHWIANVGAITGNETDLAGNPRFVDVIDMGAYESQCSLSLTSSQTNVACNGSSNGTATVTVSGGIAPYTYSWSPTGGTSATATGLSAGNYEVTVTDANGCTVTETFTITQPAVVNPPTVVDEIICSPGDVTLVASSASGLIQWYDSETSETIISNGSSLFIPNLTSSKSYWVENQELNPTIYYGGEPEINLLKSPNDLNTFINWGLIFDTSENINLLGTDVYVSNAGTIQIKVVDAAGAEICTTGNIAVTVTGLNSSMTIPLDFYIPKGTGYKLLIKSFNGAKLYRDVNNSFPIVDSQNILTIKSGYFDAPTPNYYYYFYNIAYKKYCSSERKEVQAIVINTPVPTAANQSYCITEAKTVGDLVATGTDVKWYDSANGTTELTATTLLTTGTYYATQTLYGCESARTQIEVTVSNMINTISKVDVTCNGGNNGSATVTAIGGITPYTYAWNNGISSTTNEATNLAAGTYEVTVTDANNCTTTTTVTITEPILLEAAIALANVVNVSCFDGNDGSATVTVSGGTAPYTYLWNDTNTQTTATATGLEAGTYTVTVTDANNCITTTTVTIAEPVLLEASIALANVVNVSCFDGNDGEATVTVSGGTAPYTYLWNDTNTQTTATATGLAAGTYTVTVTDANNCTTTTNVTIAEPTLLEASITLTNVVNVSCFDGNDGEATVTVSGGTAPYTYLWNDTTAQTTATAIGLQAGTYTVTVTDANNCTTTTNVTIAEPTLLEASITLTNVVNVSCFNGNDGEATVTVLGGTAPYTYLWNDTTAQTTATATGLVAGTYTVTVTDANNCTTTTNVTVTEPLVLEASIALANVVNVSCFDGNDGEATVTVLGGTAPYTYLWNDTNTQTTATATGLEAGTYTVTVTDANNCTTTTTVTIAEPILLEASIALANVVNVSCFDGNDGEATVTVSGGTAPYTYLWNDATAQTTATATGLVAGTYTVTVTDANNCTTTTTVTIAEPILLEASIALANVVNVSCFDGNDGSAMVTVSGGTAPYTYLWNDANAQTTATATGLQAGTYTVTVTDANNCTTTTTVKIAEPTLLEASIALTNVVNVSCFDGNDGSAIVTVSGGTAPYTYLWNDTTAQTTATATGLAAGTYTVTVTDANNCTTTTNVTIAEPTLLEASIALANVVNVSCFDGNDGEAMVTVSGGTAPYTYLWNDANAQTTATATGLAAGTYTVTVTDANNCTTTTTVTIAEPLVLEASIALTNVVNVSCFDGNDGEATVTVSGGTAPYTYLWNDANAQTTSTATGLQAGTYTVTVTDANNCTTTTTVTIGEPVLLEATIALTNVINVSCFDGNDGEATVTVSGGTAPYSYLWNDATAQTTATATGLEAGTYMVTVTDANNCTTTTIVTIAEPVLLEASIALANVVNVSCFDGNDGSAMVTVSGGTAPYTYLWNDTTAQTTATATGLVAGTYTVTVTDANNCTTTTNVTITEPLVLEASIALANVVNVSCFDGNDGSAMVTVSGGTAPYTYLWNDTTAQTTATATGLVAGTYTVTVTDANNCTTTTNVTVTEPLVLEATIALANVVNVSCFDGNDGEATVTVSGGTAPYTYLWNDTNTQTTATAAGLEAGTYTVTVTDANNCTTTTNVTVTEPLVLEASIALTNVVNVSCFDGNDGEATVTVTGGTAPYTYLWNDATAQTTATATGLEAGTYTVTVSDANNCTTTETFTITEPTALNVVPTQTNVLCKGAATGSASVTVSGGVAPYTYTWDNGITSTTHEATDLSAGAYTVNITDANGCTSAKTFTITEPAIIPIPIVTTPIFYTYGDTALALDALVDNGNTLLWYDAATGGLGSTNAFIPSTDTIGTQTYWVSQLTADGCESERVAIEVNVSPAILIVMADENQTKVYGSADPVFTYTATGFQFNDNDNVFTGLLSRDPGENVGTYPIHQGSLSAGPAYTITFVEATFNITAAELIVTPNNGQTKVYGSADPVYQYTVSGFVAGDSFSVISGLLGRLPGENVGNYLYHSGTLTSVHNNYTFTVLPEYFIITPAPIDVVVNPGQHKMYGTSDPFFNYSALGLVNGDSPYTAFTGVLQRSMGENVGIYAINQGTLQTNANYQLISFTAADFEIVPALIANLQLNDATYVYDGTPKSLVVTGPVDPNAQITYTGNNQINAGTYTVTATVDYGSNYQQLVLTATLTIVRANQTIFFEIDSPVILEDTPPFNLQATATSGLPVHYTYTYSGIQPAEVSASGAVELLAPGEVHITAHQDGDNNYNAAVPVTRTLVIESRDSGIWDLYIDDEHFAQPADEIFVIKGCDDTNSASVEIRVETQIGATVSPSPIIIVPTPDYGIYEVEIVVTSQNGQHTKTYKVVIDKRLPWENILMQKYDNVVFINNNPATNGGYKFVRYEWYKNDVKVADQQLFSEGATMHDLIDLSASYHAVLYTDDGKVLTTCSMTIIHKHDYSLTVYPNPVVANGILNVTYDVPYDVFTAIDYVIFTTSGQFVSRGTLEQSAAQINLPATLQSGTYILVLNINGKNKSVRFVIK